MKTQASLVSRQKFPGWKKIHARRCPSRRRQAQIQSRCGRPGGYKIYPRWTQMNFQLNSSVVADLPKNLVDLAPCAVHDAPTVPRPVVETGSRGASASMAVAAHSCVTVMTMKMAARPSPPSPSRRRALAHLSQALQLGRCCLLRCHVPTLVLPHVQGRFRSC